MIPDGYSIKLYYTKPPNTILIMKMLSLRKWEIDVRAPQVNTHSVVTVVSDFCLI